MNVAHVFPCGQMKILIDRITDAWNADNRQRLYNFVNWLFTIDTEAVINGRYLTGNAANRISFQSK